ncbi:hypothetical protein OIU74_027504 [Salix koriyanagi]|uniref:Uncharacterized protein n=1 Tax=Salix koriyanagi TaxID=2511006 RepID=A0A9Q0VSD6_9ROSI|nr:hypothetical protein OIU74_027504 [Salix koriyanagi]
MESFRERIASFFPEIIITRKQFFGQITLETKDITYGHPVNLEYRGTHNLDQN